ncbi:hypothetical protein LXA43DRAFT_893215, partial [Ganoderma leucocontextum]
ALTVVVPPTIHCGGSFIEGEGLLNFRQLQEENFDEVCVELSGDIHTCVLSCRGISTSTKRSTGYVSSQIYMQWSRGTANHQPDTDVLRLPFRFPLPDGSPSFHFHAWEINGSVLHAINTTGVRRGNFKVNKKVHSPIMVLPKDEAGGDPSLRASIRALGEPEGGPTWKTAHKETHMRRGLRGEHRFFSSSKHLLLVPNEHGILPHWVDIPVLIKVKTTTGRLARRKADKHPEGKPVFPAVEIETYSIDITLRRTDVIRVGEGANESVKDPLDHCREEARSVTHGSRPRRN